MSTARGTRELNGVWVLVCGASGAGKDSVMTWAAQHLAANDNIVFARRMVTRPPQPGSDHDEICAAQFSALQDCGGLAWHWQAHGLHYGIAARYAADVAQGRVVVVNGSREHASAQLAAENVRVAQIVAHPHEIATRLERRGRDTPNAISQRLVRNAEFAELPAHCTIFNHGVLADAGLQLAQYLSRAALAP